MSSYISKIKPNGATGTEYKLKDEEARSAIENTNNNVASFKSVTGNPITIYDAADIYAKSLYVDLEPKQDLHGQASPYVGGAGKNKVDISPVTMQSEGTFLSNYTFPKELPAGTYTISIKTSSVAAWILYLYDANGTQIAQAASSASVAGVQSVTFTLSSTATKAGGYVNAATTLSDFMLESGSVAHSYEPYENICPISGYTGVEIEDVGVNQWDEEWESGGIDYNTGNNTQEADRIRSKNFISVLPNNEYFIKSSGHTTALRFYDVNKNYISYGAAYNTDRTFTPPSNCRYLKFIILETTYNHDISINYPSTETNYHPYKTISASITFGQTVYGGNVDFNTGIVTVDKTIYTITNDSVITMNNDYFEIADVLSEDAIDNYNFVSSFCVRTISSLSSMQLGEGRFVQTRKYFAVKLPYATAEECKTALVNSNAQICYELDTSTTIQLTPEELKLLKNTNHLSSNGTTINLTYQPNNNLGDILKAAEDFAMSQDEKKVDKVDGKGLSSNDFTNADKSKLDGIEAGAQVNGTIDSELDTESTNAIQNQVVAKELQSTQTATGNPITITDAAGINAEALKVTFSPKQDLHGQSAPYVGGAGKNKFDIGNSVSGYIALSSGSSTYLNKVIAVSDNTLTFEYGAGGGTLTVRNIKYTITGNIAVSMESSTHQSRCLLLLRSQDDTRWLNGNDVTISGWTYNSYFGAWYKDDNTNNSRQTFTVNIPTNISYFMLGFGINNTSPGNNYYLSNIQLETGTTATTFAPWENICPITGYTGVEVGDTGINQWDEEWEVGYINLDTGENQPDSSKIRAKNYIRVLPNTTYYKKSLYPFWNCYYDENKNFIGYGNAVVNATFTTPANCHYIRFALETAYGTTYNHDTSINYPSTDHDYHPYKHSYASVTFGQTLYGGESDFKDGWTRDEWTLVDFGELTWGNYKTGGYYTEDLKSYIKKPSSSTVVSDCISECYKTMPVNVTLQHGEMAVDTSGTVYVVNTDYPSSASDFKTAMTGLKICYAKATHTTIATPPTDLKLLENTNHLTCDGNTIIDIGYFLNNSIGDAVKASEEYTDRRIAELYEMIEALQQNS